LNHSLKSFNLQSTMIKLRGVTKMISAGIDCGAKNTKTIILKDGRIIGKGWALSGFDQNRVIIASWESALKDAGIHQDDVDRICGTGAGKSSIKNAAGLPGMPGVQTAQARRPGLVDDIKAMAKGANYFFPRARTVTDVGAEEGRAVKIDEDGNVVDFAINEECAAGAGTFIEVMARALEVSLEEMGPLALTSDKKIPMNAQCVIFAESEVVGLIHAKTEKRDISKAIHDAMVSRIVSMIRRIGVNEDVAMIGGVGRNPGFVETMKCELRVEQLYIPDAPEYGAAVGAAVVAAEKHNHSQSLWVHR
jgi:benzoyl-CoA reductase subunit D